MQNDGLHENFLAAPYVEAGAGQTAVHQESFYEGQRTLFLEKLSWEIARISYDRIKAIGKRWDFHRIHIDLGISEGVKSTWSAQSLGLDWRVVEQSINSESSSGKVRAEAFCAQIESLPAFSQIQQRGKFRYCTIAVQALPVDRHLLLWRMSASYRGEEAIPKMCLVLTISRSWIPAKVQRTCNESEDLWPLLSLKGPVVKMKSVMGPV